MTHAIEKSLTLLVALSLILATALPVSAAVRDNYTDEEIEQAQAEAEERIDEAQETIVEVFEASDMEYDQLKTTIDELIERAIDRVEYAEDTITYNYYISDESAEVLLEGFDEIEQALMNYQDELEDTTTIQELQQLNEQLVATLKASSEEIRAAVEDGLMIIAQEAEKKIQIAQIKIEAYIEVLQITCPEASDDIQTLQDGADDLNAIGHDLAEAIEAGDEEAAEAAITEAINLASSLAGMADDVYNTCY